MDLTDPDCGINPDFCNATLVILQYCSGDRWLGSANGATTWPGNNASFFFAGAHIVRAAITELVERGFLKTGSTLFLAGHSAGAIAIASGDGDGAGGRNALLFVASIVVGQQGSASGKA